LIASLVSTLVVWSAMQATAFVREVKLTPLLSNLWLFRLLFYLAFAPVANIPRFHIGLKYIADFVVRSPQYTGQ